MILLSRKAWSLTSLLDEIEAIVYSGTKLNIDYYIDDTLDADHVDDIYDYFMESDSDSLADAEAEARRQL